MAGMSLNSIPLHIRRLFVIPRRNEPAVAQVVVLHSRNSTCPTSAGFSRSILPLSPPSAARRVHELSACVMAEHLCIDPKDRVTDGISVMPVEALGYLRA